MKVAEALLHKTLALPCALTLVFLAGVRVQTPAPVPPPADVQNHLQQIAHQLPEGSGLRVLIEAGAYGDGLVRPWMGLAKRDGVNRVEIDVGFVWHKGMHDPKFTRVAFFAGYAPSGQQITNAQALDQFAKDGLLAEVERNALDVIQKRGMWFESPEHMHPPKKGRVHGSTAVVLYDDPWLPSPPIIFIVNPSPKSVM
jgi:hypothetical protein